MAVYNDGYVWEFKVKDSAGNLKTVGVKAVAIDDSLIASEISSTGSGKLVTDTKVISYVANAIKNSLVKNITAASTDDAAPTAKAVWDLVASMEHVGIKIAVVESLPTTDIKQDTIYLVRKSGTSEQQNVYSEYIYVNNAWEMIGDTQVSLADYVKKTDYATANTGGVIVSSSATGKISVGTDGTASLNGFGDLAQTSALADYYKMSADEKTAGTGTLLSAADKSKLDGIASDATKTVITSAQKKITVTNAAGQETSLTIPEVPAAYNVIKVVGDSTETASATAGETIVFKQGDGIKLTTGGDVEGNPTVNIAVDTTNVIDVASTIEQGTDDDYIPNVGAVKAYVTARKPSYANGCIDLTV